MKRIWIVLTLYFMLALIIGATGCIKAPPASEKYEIEFRQTVWQINDYGDPVLKIAFTLSEAEIPKWAILDRLRAWSVRLFPENGYKLKLHLTLIDPDGIEVASDIISSGAKEAKLDLFGNMPKAGQYRLIVREGFMGKIIATETLSFEGAEATISDVELTFSSLTTGHVDLRDIRYNIRNDGDIPVCFNKVKLVIGDKEISTMPVMIPKGVVLPKAEKTFHTMPFGITKIKPGEYAANLELRDDRTDEVVCSYSFVITPGMSHETDMTHETEFELTQWEVVDHVGEPALLLRFTLFGNIAFLYLTNPDGFQTDSNFVIVGINEITLDIAGSGEMPDSGQYALIVKDDFGNIIAKEVFYFEGAEATISDVELTWDYMENFEFYSLKRISFIVSNNGDLPAYIFEARIAIGDKVYPISPTMPFEVLPGEMKTIEESLIFTGITSGDKEFILELKDSTGKVVGSYSCNVTPTE